MASLISPAVEPLAQRMRPRHLTGVLGQEHLLGEGRPLAAMVAAGRLRSMILWGPPGTGKTTIAALLAEATGARFVPIAAVSASVKELRVALDDAQASRHAGRQTVLFVDEIHRFNKAQQDVLLPATEAGGVVLIGATTENPSFEVVRALLSRAPVYVLHRLEPVHLEGLLRQAMATDPALAGLRLDEKACTMMASWADGDARRALGLLEAAVAACATDLVDESTVRRAVPAVSLHYDKQGDAFYDLISALHKAVRGSAPDAALYWLARLMEGGAEPLYVARRVVRMASEDVGAADPRALALALDAWEVLERLGSPEGELALAQAVVYIALAPKSNAMDKAWQAALAAARNTGSLPVPLHLRNAPTALMRELGYGRRYRFPHDEPFGYAAGERYFPDGMPAQSCSYYQPTDRGLEARMRERLAALQVLDEQQRKSASQAGCAPQASAAQKDPENKHA